MDQTRKRLKVQHAPGNTLAPIFLEARQKAEVAQQHGPVKVLMKDGKRVEPQLSEPERKAQASLFVDALAPLAKPPREYPD